MGCASRFQCNYCDEKVPALPKLKFKVQMTDLTDSVEAMVFAEVAQQYYGITGADIDTTAMDGSLPLPLLHKLSQPKECTIHLRAEMNDYRGINECKFIVQSIFDSPAKESATSKQPLLLDPPTPNKKSKVEKYTAKESSINSEEKTPENATAMDAEDNQPLEKKND